MEMLSQKKIYPITGATLKWIAIATMLIDHIGAVFGKEIITVCQSQLPYYILRVIGRIAFPIFCFLLVEGFRYTKSQSRYMSRLLLFALLSELPFDLTLKKQMIDFSAQNVFFTLFLGALALWVMERFAQNMLAKGMLCAMLILAAELLRTDYGGQGVLLIMGYSIFRFEKGFIGRFVVTILSLVVLGSLIELGALFAFIPIVCYNGKRGKQRKYFFYFFYPVHLLVLYGLHL